jgi:hypothetical protein
MDFSLFFYLACRPQAKIKKDVDLHADKFGVVLQTRVKTLETGALQYKQVNQPLNINLQGERQEYNFNILFYEELLNIYTINLCYPFFY